MGIKKKTSEYRKCRICGVKVKIRNFENHFLRVHPLEVNRLKILDFKVGECVVCGKNIDASEYVCREHKIEILQRFLVGKALPPLRKYVDNIVQKSSNECTDYFLQFFPISIFAEVGTDIMEIGYEELVVHSNKSVFLSYVLLRLCQIIPPVAERAYELASRESGGGQFRSRYDTDFIEVLLSEFEFFYALYFGVQGFYSVVADSMETPSVVVIIPEENEESVLSMLMLRIKDSEAVYRGSLYPVIHRSSLECLYDENGAFLCYSREYIIKHFDSFKAIWLSVFGSELPFNDTEYFDFLWHFKSVVSPHGFTKRKKSKAYNLSDYKGLDEDGLFNLLDVILPDVGSKVHLISTKSLGTHDPYYSILTELFRLSWGFKFSSPEGNSYFLPVIDWLHNLLCPVLSRFGRTLQTTGAFFEEWIENAVKAFADGLLGFQFTREFGYVPIKSREAKKAAATDWRVLERNLKIDVDGKNAGETLKHGEVDLVIYANYNIYLLELKSANLSGKRAVKYLEKKAPVQCSKYATWARKRENIESLLAKHGIPGHRVNAVRILCCTNGVHDRTSVTNTETGERFAVVPFFLLVNLFAGVFTVAIKDVFPFFITEIRNGLKLAFPSLHEAYLVDNTEKLSEMANAIVYDWYSLMTFDRQQDFVYFKEKKPHSFNLAGFFVHRESYVGGTSDWLLAEPVLIGTTDNVKYYVGTQIAVKGTTLFCSQCESAIKYYYSPDERQNSILQEILTKKTCPFCHQSMEIASEDVDIVSRMSRLVLEFRSKMDSQILGDL